MKKIKISSNAVVFSVLLGIILLMVLIKVLFF